jgi:hypothetical protein
MWDWSPLVVNEASHGFNGEGVENTPLVVHYLDHAPKPPLQFHPGGTNSEVASCSPYTIGL